MKSRLSMGLVTMMAALLLSLIPAAGIAVQPASAQTICDAAQFVADVTVPDGTTFSPGATFNKTWRLKNIGSCTWTTSYSLVFASGEQMGGPASVALPQSVAPGQTVDVTVSLTAPSAAGTYTGFWQFKNASNSLFGIGTTASKSWWVLIKVALPQQQVTVFDFTQNVCSAQWSYVGGPIPCPTNPNKIAYGHVELLSNPTLESGVGAGMPSLLTVPQNKFYGAIRGVYQVRPLLGDHFQATIGCQYQAYSCYVTFELDYMSGGTLVTVWKAREKYDGLVAPVDVDLSAISFKRIDGLVLIVTAFGSATDAMPVWVAPRIVRMVSGTIPTPTPTQPGAATATPPPPASCDRAQFVADVTVPDGTVFAPNAPFIKTWRLKNVGTCTWTTSYGLVFDTGDQMGGPASTNFSTSVAPGQTVDLSVNLTAPSSAGSYRGYWKFKNANGVPFGIGANGTNSWWVDIKVSGPTATPTSPATPGPTTTPGAGAAGTMYDFAANACSAAWFSGAGSLPCPGTDGDQKGFVLKVTNPKLETGTTDTRLGLLTFPQNINNGYIQGIYPNYKVKAGDRFRSIINCEFGATSCYVVFRLDYQTGTGPITTFWAFVEKYDNQYYQADLDLTPLVGQDVKFILTVLSTGSPTGDRALWVAPMIYNPSMAATSTPPPPTAAPSATAVSNHISIVNLSFQPQALQVPVGTTVTWTNNDSTAHTVTSDTGLFDSGTLNVGNTFSFTFTQAGTFTYHCNIHPMMTGAIVVVPASPSPTATGTDTSSWNKYQNVKYGFSFKFPPGSSVASQSDNSGRIYLPLVTQGTNLGEKYVDISVVEGATTCKSPNTNAMATSQNVTINGIAFLKETGEDAGAGNLWDWIAYSTTKGTACISLTFILHSLNPGNFTTPPPVFDMNSESAVFSTIMSTYANQ